MTTSATLITEGEFETIYSASVTLRQVEEAGIQLDTGFGADDDEHACLLDDPTILRLTFGVAAVEVRDGYEVREVYGVQAYDQRLGEAEPMWSLCLAKFNSHFNHQRNQREAQQNLYKVENLVRCIVGEDPVAAIIESASKPHQVWINELAREGERDRELQAQVDRELYGEDA